MDRTPLDALARSLKEGISRRGVLAGIAGGVLATLPHAPDDDVFAKKKKKGKRKKQCRCAPGFRCDNRKGKCLPDGSAPQTTACTAGAQVGQVAVPYNGTPVLSPVLAQGQVYTVQVSGSAPTNGTHSVDAEYDFITATPNDLTKITDVAVVDIGVSIDDPTVDSSKTPKWGPYNPAHFYQQKITGQGRAVSLLMQDSIYEDNSGAVTVTFLCG